MKRVVSLVAALALAVGAFAPAAFASDAGYGQTDLIPLEDLDQETFDTYLSKFYSQDYPTYGVLDLIRDSFQGGLSNASGLNDSPWSWALNLVDNASDLGTEVGLWLRGVQIDPNTGKVIYPDDYLTDYAKQQLDIQLKSTPSLDRIVTDAGGVWLKCPFSYSSYRIVGSSSSQGLTNTADIYVSILRSGAVAASYYAPSDPAVYCNYAFINNAGNASYAGGGSLANSFLYNNTSYKVANNVSDFFRGAFGSFAGYSNYTEAFNDFFGYVPDVEPVWNGSGYYSDHQDGFSINLPSLPSTNWGNLSKYYYTTYGDEIIEGDNVDRYYYNISNNYVPYEISYELPYWLINGSTDILDFDYSLELPTAELSTLPVDFEGGSNFWDNSFSMLAGFGSFIVLGLSFALVGLFFKD